MCTHLNTLINRERTEIRHGKSRKPAQWLLPLSRRRQWWPALQHIQYAIITHQTNLLGYSDLFSLEIDNVIHWKMNTRSTVLSLSAKSLPDLLCVLSVTGNDTVGVSMWVGLYIIILVAFSLDNPERVS